MKDKPKYIISSGGITVHFTADQVRASQRVKLASELIELNNAESLPTDEFLKHHSLNIGAFTMLPELYPTVGELAKATDKELLSIRYFGKRRLYFLREALKKEGY